MTDHDPFFDPENITGKYILDEFGEPQPEPHLLKWAAFMETTDRHLAETYIGQTRISTMFMALDLGIARLLHHDAAPILWETMVFGPCAMHHYQRRYRSRQDAIAGHAIACELVRRFGHPPRRLKKALRKFNAGKRPRPGDARRIQRWLTRVHEYERR